MTDHSNASRNLTRPLFPWWFWVVSATITLVWFFGPQIISWHRGSGNALKANEFGDQFGSINTLFSGLAFLGVLAGIFIQGREFRAQLDEMRANAEEMANQSATYRLQLESAKHQNMLTETQLKHYITQERISAQPFLALHVRVNNSQTLTLDIENFGSPVYRFKVTPQLDEVIYEHLYIATPLLKNDSPLLKKQLQFEPNVFGRNLSLLVEYVTRLGTPSMEIFTIETLEYSHEYQRTSDMHQIAIDIAEYAKV